MDVDHLSVEEFKGGKMARNLNPKCRQCRRIGEKLFLKGARCYTEKCALDRRKKAPGMHGGRRRKLSDYGLQLNEKQKVKKMYGMMENQFRRYYEKASRMPGVTGHNLLKLLEKRLDNVVYRAGFATSRNQARQFVRHGHILVNGKRVDIPSYLIKVNDVIEIKDKFRQNDFLKDAIDRASTSTIPEWLSVESDKFKATVLREPERSDISANINETAIVEFYSK